MKWLDELKADRNALREAKREWRNKHFLNWLVDRIFVVVLAGLVLLAGYSGGAGFIDGDVSGTHTIGGVYLDDGSWNVIVKADENPDYGRFWAKREYLECYYDSFNGPLIRRYWIGDEIEISRKLSRLELLEFEKYLQGYLGEGFRTYDRQSYDRKMASGAVELFKACPFTATVTVD